MQAIRAMFIAITMIQKAAGNSSPRITGWAALSGQLFIPIYFMVEKIKQNGSSVVAISAGISCLVIFLLTYSIAIPQSLAKDLPSLKIKFFLIFFISTVALAGIAKFSPGLSLAAYLAFSFLPIHKALNPINSKDHIT